MSELNSVEYLWCFYCVKKWWTVCRRAWGWRTQECSHKYTISAGAQIDTRYSILNMCIFDLGWVSLLVVSLAWNVCIWARLWAGVIYLPSGSVSGPVSDPGSLDRALFLCGSHTGSVFGLVLNAEIPHTTETLKCKRTTKKNVPDRAHVR